MNFLEFTYSILKIISIDILVGFSLYLIWKYLDLKYFSTCEVSQLKEEINYLKEENKKIKGTSTNFWGE